MKDACRLLLAEDDAYDARLARLVIEGTVLEGNMLVVANGKEALDYLHRRAPYADIPLPQPAVVLLDLNMPGMDGFAVLELVKTDPALRAIPVIVLTAWNSTSDKIKGFELGAVDYLTKPFETAELRARVCSALRTKRLQDELAETNRDLLSARVSAGSQPCPIPGRIRSVTSAPAFFSISARS